MKTKHVLVLGAGGNVSRHTIPKLVAQGHSVSALVRNPDHVQQLVDDGATAIVRDLTTLDEEDWARLLTPFDAVVWSAGAGGSSANSARSSRASVPWWIFLLANCTPTLSSISALMWCMVKDQALCF